MDELLTTKNRLAIASGRDKRSRIMRDAIPVAHLLLGAQIVPLFAVNPAANSIPSILMKNDKPKTLDAARDRISDLEADLAKANEKLVSTNVANLISTASKDAPAIAANVQPDAVVKPPVKRTPEDVGLTLEPVTEDSLMESIRGETDYKKRWILQRSLARLQEARAQNEVQARRGKPIGTMEIRRK